MRHLWVVELLRNGKWVADPLLTFATRQSAKDYECEIGYVSSNTRVVKYVPVDSKKGKK